MRRILSFLSFIILILITTLAIVLYARGYRINLTDKKLSGTGVLSASSCPDKASIFINGKLTSATSASLSLNPASYQVKITKEGYIPWEKNIKVQKEIVNQIDALLIPRDPSLRAITVNGILNPVLSPNSSKLAFMIPPDSSASSDIKQKYGIFILELRNSPFSGKVDAKQVYQPADLFDWKNTRLIWSPDERQVIAVTYKKDIKNKDKETLVRALLFSIDNGNNLPTEITTSFDAQIAEWDTLSMENEKIKLSVLPEKISPVLLQKTEDLRLSPDDTKVLYLATSSAELVRVIDPPLIGANSTEENRKIEDGNYYIYDIREDKNYPVTDTKTMKDSKKILWYSDSKHVITVEQKAIYITDYDGSNKRSVYSGPFNEDYVYAWPSGDRLAIVTNFQNPDGNPNLYELDLR